MALVAGLDMTMHRDHAWVRIAASTALLLLAVLGLLWTPLPREAGEALERFTSTRQPAEQPHSQALWHAVAVRASALRRWGVMRGGRHWAYAAQALVLSVRMVALTALLPGRGCGAFARDPPDCMPEACSVAVYALGVAVFGIFMRIYSDVIVPTILACTVVRVAVAIATDTVGPVGYSCAVMAAIAVGCTVLLRDEELGMRRNFLLAHQLRRALQVRTSFTARIAHEMRNSVRALRRRRSAQRRLTRRHAACAGAAGVHRWQHAAAGRNGPGR